MSLGMDIAKVRYNGKPLFYHSDGTGRDTYVLRNNGGLLSQPLLKSLDQKWEKKPDLVKMRLGKNDAYRSTLPAFSDKFVHYHSDGSGRDSYVKWNHGGRIQNFNSKNNTENFFRTTLRTYPKMASSLTQSGSSQGFDFTNTNFYLSEKQQAVKLETHQRQVQSSQRLARHKIPLAPAHSQSEIYSRYGLSTPQSNSQINLLKE